MTDKIITHKTAPANLKALSFTGAIWDWCNERKVHPNNMTMEQRKQFSKDYKEVWG